MDSGRDLLIAELLRRALLVSAAAGELLTDHRPEVLAVESKSVATDIVTDMDRRSEHLIVQQLLDGRGADGILAEEGSAQESASGVRWVIDPIDGTVNYLYGIPLWAVCIGVELDGVPVAGVVAVPELGQTYYAAVGGGAWLRSHGADRAIRVSSVAELRLALTATGFGYSPARRRLQAKVAAQLIPKFRDIRRAGTASIDICWLASGRVDAYYEVGLKPWDYTAACVIAAEAGAVMQGLVGQPPSEALAMGTNPALLAEFRLALTAAGADRILSLEAESGG